MKDSSEQINERTKKASHCFLHMQYMQNFTMRKSRWNSFILACVSYRRSQDKRKFEKHKKLKWWFLLLFLFHTTHSFNRSTRQISQMEIRLFSRGKEGDNWKGICAVVWACSPAKKSNLNVGLTIEHVVNALSEISWYYSYLSLQYLLQCPRRIPRKDGNTY